MSDKLTIELTTQQRDLLLNSLRISRHYVLMEIQEPASDLAEARSARVLEIEALTKQLKNAAAACETSDVT